MRQSPGCWTCAVTQLCMNWQEEPWTPVVWQGARHSPFLSAPGCPLLSSLNQHWLEMGSQGSYQNIWESMPVLGRPVPRWTQRGWKKKNMGSHTGCSSMQVSRASSLCACLRFFKEFYILEYFLFLVRSVHLIALIISKSVLWITWVFRLWIGLRTRSPNTLGEQAYPTARMLGNLQQGTWLICWWAGPASCVLPPQRGWPDRIPESQWAPGQGQG